MVTAHAPIAGSTFDERQKFWMSVRDTLEDSHGTLCSRVHPSQWDLTLGTSHGLEVSSLNFVKVSLCLSQELSECKRYTGGSRVLNGRASVSNVVDVTDVASRALLVSLSSVDPVVLGRIQLFEFFWCMFKAWTWATSNCLVVMLPCFFVWTCQRHNCVVSDKWSDPQI